MITDIWIINKLKSESISKYKVKQIIPGVLLKLVWNNSLKVHNAIVKSSDGYIYEISLVEILDFNTFPDKIDAFNAYKKRIEICKIAEVINCMDGDCDEE